MIDLSADLAEGARDEAKIWLMITSANVACGGHIGDTRSMATAVRRAKRHGVRLGAHPSYPDREHFGRIDILDSPGVRPADLPGIVTDQLVLFQKVCDACGAKFHHVKFHGALYNRAARDPAVSAILCETIRQFDPSLIIYGLRGSVMKEQAERCGLRFAGEIFADRSYLEDGSLRPRTEPGALIEDPVLAVRQVLGMISGAADTVRADTVCIHGDGPHAFSFAQTIHAALLQQGIAIRPPHTIA